MKKEIDLDLSELIGLTLKKVDADRIEFSKAILELWCPWRAYDKLIFLNAKVFHEKDHTAEIKRIVHENLIGRKIKSIKIFEKPCDISITLEGEIVIEVFPDHPLYESWNLKFEGRDGKHLIGTPGGEVTWFLNDKEV